MPTGTPSSGVNDNKEPPLWIPGPDRIAGSELTRFAYALHRKGHTPTLLSNYSQLHQWSVDQKEDFWSAIWTFFDVLGRKEGPVLSHPQRMPGCQWFPQSTLNFAENLLRRAGTDAAIIAYSEDGKRREISWDTLRKQVARLAMSLRESGVGKGDRVAAILPNGIVAIVGMLATTSLGAVWSSCSPDFGVQGILDRFGQIGPKVVIGATGYQYGGKQIDTTGKVSSIVESLATVSTLYWDNQHLPSQPSRQVSGLRCFDLDRDILLAETPAPPLAYTACAFNDPLFVMYSSGTTGVPKCIVHGVGGTLLQHLKELSLHTNLTESSRLMYFTTCGWMMWNWMVSALALGCPLVVYDGSPFYPSSSRLFDIVDAEGVTTLGAGAKFYSACDKAGLKPRKSHQLKELDTLLSTGSPLAHETFVYLYQEVKNEVCVSSISGGTDIISCFALGNPNLPVYRGELQCIGLGMDVDFVDANGEHLKQGQGELICRQPFPSMPVGFWDDPQNEKFRNAYFDKFPDQWAHGDYGEFIQHPQVGKAPAQTGIIIHGRSDATLNPGGIRIGTAEIYRQVEKLSDVLESIAVGQRRNGDERIVLFVKLRNGVKLTDTLVDEIRQTIRSNTTPRHVPAVVAQVPDIPRTISGKITELAVRHVIHGEEVKNKEALANPEALEHYRNHPALGA